VPTVYVPDELVFEIVKMGKDHKKYITDAVKEKLSRDGVVLKRGSGGDDP